MTTHNPDCPGSHILCHVTTASQPPPAGLEKGTDPKQVSVLWSSMVLSLTLKNLNQVIFKTSFWHESLNWKIMTWRRQERPQWSTGQTKGWSSHTHSDQAEDPCGQWERRKQAHQEQLAQSRHGWSTESENEVVQSCPTLCDPMGNSLHQAPPSMGLSRQDCWSGLAISFSNAWKWKVKVKSLSRVRLLATPWTAAYQAPPSMGFSRQESWSGVPLEMHKFQLRSAWNHHDPELSPSPWEAQLY